MYATVTITLDNPQPIYFYVQLFKVVLLIFVTTSTYKC
jgi:hypothetical protein